MSKHSRYTFFRFKCVFSVYCLFMCFVTHATQERENVTTYEGAQVWRTNIRTEQDIEAVKKLFEDQVISLWKLEHTLADFLIQADNQLKVKRILNKRNLRNSVLISDVNRRLDDAKIKPPIWTEDALRNGHRLNWKTYPTLSVINEYFDYLTERFPALCHVTTIGYSVEKRPIKMVKISNGNPNNTALLITSGIHAREWIGVTSNLYVLYKIVTNFDQLPSYMKTIDWIIIPVSNPDGFEYTFTTDRFWRKNRQKRENVCNCVGVDLNRNFDIHWDKAVTDKNECSEAYSGPHPFSEAESIVIRNMIKKPKESSLKKPSAMIDVHSYGQVILYPWSGTPKPTKRTKLLRTIAKAMSQAIYKSTGETYTFGTAYHTMYPASGCLGDWMYSSGINLSFTIEMRDRGKYLFFLPPDFIVTTGQDLLAAVKELAKTLTNTEKRKEFNTELVEVTHRKLIEFNLNINIKVDMEKV